MRIYLTLIFSLLFVCLSFGQSSADFWKDKIEDDVQIATTAERQVFPNHFRLMSLKWDDMKSYLNQAPTYSGKSEQKTLEIEVPFPDGTFQTFEIFERSLMQEPMASKYPNTKTYIGKNPKTGSIIALEQTNRGFTASIRGLGFTFYIDPYAEGDLEHYMVYDIKEDPDNWGDPQKLACGLTDNSVFEDYSAGLTKEQVSKYRKTDLVEQKTFIIALACTGEFVSSRGGKTAMDGLLNTALNRMNQIWGPEFASQLVFHPTTDELWFENAMTDPYPVGDVGGEILGRNQDVFNQRINIDEYDIGHCFTNRCSDVGGVASGANACTRRKAGGMTCNGGGVNISTWAHEMGHQNSVSHSWDNCPGNDGQRASIASYEPGSGTTIMSYSGACGTQNIGADDDYYSNGSIAQFMNWTRNVHEGCGTITTPGNHYPEIQWPYTNGFHIPVSTPFELEAEATDEDGDNLTYSWEQHDLRNVPTIIGQPMDNCPIYRSYPAVGNGYRSFPRKNMVVNPPVNIPPYEILADYGRDFNFTLTVRDNHPTAGGVVWEQLSFKTAGGSGPFLVTSQAADTVTWTGGELVDITWDVANTNKAPIDAGAVDIYFSPNNGFDFDILLAKATINDGHERVFAPNLTTSAGRIKIKGTDNIFYNVNTTRFAVEEATEPSFTASVTPQYQYSCLPDDMIVEIETNSILGFDSLLNIELVTTLPAGISANLTSNQVKAGEAATLTLEMTNDLGSGSLPLEIIIFGTQTDTITKEILIEFARNDFSLLKMVSPANGAIGVSEGPVLRWNNITDADEVDFQLATSPAFESNTIVWEGTGIRDTFFVDGNLLEENTAYFWRVRPFNQCGSGEYLTPFSFHTVSKTCKTSVALDGDNLSIPIPGASRQIIKSSIPILETGVINDLNIPNIKGSYEPINSLRMTLVSPDSIRAILFEGRCTGSVYNFGFDDAVSSRNPCPANDGNVRGPQEFLERFNGTELTGTWNLEIEVFEPGTGGGGSLQEWQIEFCADLALLPPVLAKDTLPVPFGLGENVSSDFLNASTASAIEPWDLTYTVVALPEFGTLTKNGNPMKIGDTFTQFNVDQGIIWYRHDSNNSEPFDKFLFTLRDKEGGWVGNQEFNFRIDLTSSSEDINVELGNKISLFPNPADATINIQINEFMFEQIQVELFNAQGQLIKVEQFRNANATLQMDVSKLSEGFYFLSFLTEKGRASKRIMIGR